MKINAKTKRTEAVRKINAFLKKAQAEEEPDETEEDADEEAGEEEADEEVSETETAPDFDEEMEEDEEETEEDASTETRLDKIEEVLETIVDSLADQKEVLETVVSGDSPKEDQFEDFVEEEEGSPESEDEFTSDELGLDEELLTVGRKESRPMDLRKQRKARLHRLAQGVDKPRDDGSETLAEEFGLDESKKNVEKVTIPPVTIGKPAPSEIPENLKAADLTLEKLDDKNAWHILNSKDQVLYIIHRGNINAKVFNSPDFGKKVIKDMQSMGVINALRKYKAKKILLKQANAVPDQVKTVLAADLRRRFVRALKLAITAMNKNLVQPVPLKRALFSVLDGVGVDHPEVLIEAAFQQSASEHFDVALAQAEKYMGMSDEAFVETEAAIGETNVAVPPTSLEVSAHNRKSADTERRAVAGSLPFDSASEEEIDDSFETRIAAAVPKPKLARLLAGNQ